MDEPVIHCVEWRCTLADRSVSAAISGFLDEAEGVQSMKSPHEELRGLCFTCGKNKICSLPKPEEGIWHCVEYQLIL
jgi:hypothetical protein